MENVAVIGASNKEERYSNQAMKLLAQSGHNPIPVAPAVSRILDRPAYASLAQIKQKIDTVTLYIGPERQTEVLEHILRQPPRRVIFNPGTENPQHYPQLRAAGIEVVQACTLVMLRTGQF